jgi:hypothetical protein
MRAWIRKYRTVIIIGLVTSMVATYLVQGLEWAIPHVLAVIASAAPEWILGFVLGVVTAAYWIFGVATLALLLRRLSLHLINKAAARLPRRARARYSAEWRGELQALHSRPITGLMFAARVWVASGQIGKLL